MTGREIRVTKLTICGNLNDLTLLFDPNGKFSAVFLELQLNDDLLVLQYTKLWMNTDNFFQVLDVKNNNFIILWRIASFECELKKNLMLT